MTFFCFSQKCEFCIRTGILFFWKSKTTQKIILSRNNQYCQLLLGQKRFCFVRVVQQGASNLYLFGIDHPNPNPNPYGIDQIMLTLVMDLYTLFPILLIFCLQILGLMQSSEPIHKRQENMNNSIFSNYDVYLKSEWLSYWIHTDGLTHECFLLKWYSVLLSFGMKFEFCIRLFIREKSQ